MGTELIPSPVEPEMDQRLKERITGTTVLVLLAVVLIPLILDDSRVVETRITTTNIPEKPDEEFTTRLAPIPEQDDIVPAEEEVDDGPARAVVDADPEQPDIAAEPEPVADAAVAETGTAGLTGWVVQVGSFSRKNADSLNDKLRAEGYPSYVVDEPVTAKDGSLLYRVRIGPEVLRSGALKLKAEIKKEMDLDGFVLNYP